MNRKILFIRQLACGILLVFLLTMCAPASTPTPAQGGTGMAGFDLQCQSNPDYPPPQELLANPFFVEGQVILTGTSGAISEALQQIRPTNVLTEIMRCEFTFPRQLPSPQFGASKFDKKGSRESAHTIFPFFKQGEFTLVAGDKISMNLYSFNQANINLGDLLAQIRGLDPLKAGPVYADPNYLTGHLANSACGNPFGVEGSPFGVEGSPFGVEGSLFGGAEPNAQEKDFWDQWAFTKIGLVKPGDRKENQTGSGVRVGVFDTSPYTLNSTTEVITEPKISPALTLTVHHRFEIPELASVKSLDVSDHGLFASSLIHAVAFESEIHLYRVLSPTGCGDLYHLNIAMLDFIGSGSDGKGLKQPEVISLSLGVRKPREALTDQQQQTLAEICQPGKELDAIQAAYCMIKEESSIESLEFVVSLAYRAGIVVVAAAGNDSVYGSIRLPMELPAAYPYVLGVSATNQDDGPACYTNEGDVAAPGGAALLDTTTGPDPAGTPIPICKSNEAYCTANNLGGQCEFGVIGLFSHSPSNYAYWVGTSFATPLVSGLAAVAYQQTGSPRSVFEQIANNVQPIPDSNFGTGIVQFP